MDFQTVFTFFYQFAENFSYLALASIGLIIIFGMMGVINMAHGELMMIGAYTTVALVGSGVPIVISIMAAGLAAAAAGMVMERLIIRRFYNQLLSSLVVTWGLSLVLSQGFLLIFGPGISGVATPLGSFQIGTSSFSYYRLVLFLVALGLVIGVWALLRYTKFGVRARATMANRSMAEALGANTSRIYSLTFAVGAALGGIAGGMFALTAEVSPFFGANYTPWAFITVVVGGSANVITGILASTTYLGGVQTILTNVYNTYAGYIGAMAGALVMLLLLPSGISDWLEKLRLSRVRAQSSRRTRQEAAAE